MTKKTTVSLTELTPPSTSKDSGNGGVKLERTITLFGGCTMLVGIIVGSGIFASTREVLKNSTTSLATILIWAICGLYCIFGALCYAELGTIVPSSGGDYVYITKAFGPMAGYIFLWISLFIINPSCIAVTSITFARYVLKPIFCGVPPPNATILIAACILLIIALVNCYRISWATNVQSFSTFAKVAILGAIIFCGIYYCIFVDASKLSWTSLIDGFEDTKPLSLASAFRGGIFTFNGWAYLNLVAEEVKEPTNAAIILTRSVQYTYMNLPRAIFISLPFVTLLYVCINVAYLTVLTRQEIINSQAVAVDFAVAALPKTFGQIALYVIPLFVAISCIGGLNGTIFTYARMFFAGAREGQLPEIIAMINPCFLTPMVSIMLLTTISLVLICIASDDTLIQYMAFSQILIYATVVASLIKIRLLQPKNISSSLKVPLVIPFIFVAASIGVLIVVVSDKYMELIKAAAVISVGVPFYFFFVQRQLLPNAVYRLWSDSLKMINKNSSGSDLDSFHHNYFHI